MSESENQLPSLSEKYFSHATFVDIHPYDKAHGMAKALNAYISEGFNWYKVYTKGHVSKTSVVRYLKCDRFRQCVASLGPMASQLAESTLHDLMTNGPAPERFKSACAILARYEPENWDPGVRRAKAQTAGEIAHSIFKAKLDVDTVEAIEAKDPFGKDS